ncbi:MAG TPA: hypothetical protein VMR21_06665 [Vicinamibacteria bacterium]|nr:hypothetical protein [Vicinamibacteria bacterium]
MTEKAAEGLRQVLTDSRTPREQAIKLVPTDTGEIAMTIASPAAGDELVDAGGRPLLIVDSALTSRLDGVVVDVSAEDEKEEAPRFVLRRAEA